MKFLKRSRTPHSSLSSDNSVISTPHSSLSLVTLVNDLLNQGYGVRFQAPGRSMYPTIREGETITVQPIDPCNVKPGDILLYQVGKRMIAHRLVSIGNDAYPPHSVLSTQYSSLFFPHSVLSTQYSSLSFHSSLSFILRGDASNALDEAIIAHQILGKVISVERNGKILDLYCRRAKIYQQFHINISRLKRRIFR